MTAVSLITDEMRAAIGVAAEPYVREVDKTSVRMFARAVGYTDPVFYDEEVAKSQGYRSLPAPTAFLGTPVYDPALIDPVTGRAPGRVQIGSPVLKRHLNGGQSIEYFDTVCAGDLLTATQKITDVAQREGSLGTMLIYTTATTFKRDGQTVATVTATVILY